MKAFVKIKSIENITHDVLQIMTEKPEEIEYMPGQATEIFIDKEGWQNEGRPFTFTSLPKNDYLQFTIKTYPERKGVTNKLNDLKKGDQLILNDVFGAIAYKGEGVFIAGGAGVTPFISIFRSLMGKDKIGGNKLLFANNMVGDIILKDEFEAMLGENFINILSEEKTDQYAYGLISEEFLKKHISDKNDFFYLCGPPPMMKAVEEQLKNIGISEKSIVTEEF